MFDSLPTAIDKSETLAYTQAGNELRADSVPAKKAEALPNPTQADAGATGAAAAGAAAAATATAASGKESTLPALTISGAGAGADSNTHWYSGALAVSKDLAKGAYDEVTQHPLHVLEDVALGAVWGATVVAVGAVAPEVATAVAVGAAAYTGYEMYEHGGNVIKDTQAVANPKDHTADQVAKGHADLQYYGGIFANVIAGSAGAMAGAAGQGYMQAARSGAGADAPAAVAADTADILAPAEKPFTLADTTFKVGDQSAWSQLVAQNGNSEYGAASLRYANDWATAMDKEIATSGFGPDVAQKAALSLTQVDGDHNGLATLALIKSWQYGPQLAKMIK